VLSENNHPIGSRPARTRASIPTKPMVSRSAHRPRRNRCRHRITRSSRASLRTRAPPTRPQVRRRVGARSPHPASGGARPACSGHCPAPARPRRRRHHQLLIPGCATRDTGRVAADELVDTPLERVLAQKHARIPGDSLCPRTGAAPTRAHHRRAHTRAPRAGRRAARPVASVPGDTCLATEPGFPPYHTRPRSWCASGRGRYAHPFVSGHKTAPTGIRFICGGLSGDLTLRGRVGRGVQARRTGPPEGGHHVGS
jgi:hypothetical protein